MSFPVKQVNKELCVLVQSWLSIQVVRVKLATVPTDDCSWWYWKPTDVNVLNGCHCDSHLCKTVAHTMWTVYCKNARCK